MRYCPECRTEYEDWATACVDCDRALEPGLPPEPPEAPHARALQIAPGDDWAYLTNVPNSIIGNLLVNQLQNNGILAMLRRSSSADIGEWSHNDFVMHDILVPGSRVAEARHYIDSPPGSPYGAGGGWPQGEWQPLTPLVPGDPAPEPADGWSSLPGESDYLQQRALRKMHGAGPFGAVESGPVRLDAYDDEDEDDPWDRTSPSPRRWFRIILGLLFLAASLPWFMQFFQLMLDMLKR